MRLFGCIPPPPLPDHRHVTRALRYRFNHTLSVDPWGPNYHPCAAQTCHGVELAFVFCTARVLGYNITAEEDALCLRVQVRRALPAVCFCNTSRRRRGARSCTGGKTVCGSSTIRRMPCCTCGAHRMTETRSMCSKMFARGCGIPSRIEDARVRLGGGGFAALGMFPPKIKRKAVIILNADCQARG